MSEKTRICGQHTQAYMKIHVAHIVLGEEMLKPQACCTKGSFVLLLRNTHTHTHTNIQYTHTKMYAHIAKNMSAACKPDRAERGCRFKAVGTVEVWKLHVSYTSVLSHFSKATLLVILFMHLVFHIWVCECMCVYTEIRRWVHVLCVSSHLTAGPVRRWRWTVWREMSLCVSTSVWQLHPSSTLPTNFSHIHSIFKFKILCKYGDITEIRRDVEFIPLKKKKKTIFVIKI